MMTHGFGRRPIATTLICLAAWWAQAAPCMADPFTMGWFSGAAVTDYSQNIVNIGGSVALYYHQGYLTDATVLQRLNSAHAKGLKIIMNVDGITQVGSDVTAVDPARITQFVNTFKNHPAVVGWYTADEPSGAAQLAMSIQAYDAVKAADTARPVYLASNRSNDSTIVDYAPAYDVMIFDTYVFAQDDPEFHRLENDGVLGSRAGLKTILDRVATRAAQANRPWVYAGQGFGRSGGHTRRLPTRDEHRFQTYYTYLKGGQSFLAWEYSTALTSVAGPGDPYPKSGLYWNIEVYKPLAEEIAIVGAALGAGADHTHVSDNIAAIVSSLHVDPDTGKHYLLALNEESGDHQVTFDISLPGDWAEAVPLDGGGAIAISSGQFTDAFDGYEVVVYELVPVPEPATGMLILAGLGVLLRRRHFSAA